MNRLLLVSLLVGALVTAPGLFLAPAGAAPAGSRSLNLCVVEPGFATAGDQFSLHTQGPAKLDETATLTGSACGSYRGIPAGDYAITQSASPPGWQLAQIRCFETGHTNTAVGTVTSEAGSVALTLRVPTVCIFAELPAAATSAPSSRSSGGSTTHSTTTSMPKGTPKPPTPPAPGGTPPNPNFSFCKLHPTKCGI